MSRFLYKRNWIGPCQLSQLFVFFRLFVINCAVLYNLIFVIGRSVFWQLQNLLPIGWFVLDYFSDLIYVLDIIVRYVIYQNQLVFFFVICSTGLTRDFSTRESWSKTQSYYESTTENLQV